MWKALRWFVTRCALSLCMFLPVWAEQAPAPTAEQQEILRRMEVAPKRGLLYEVKFEKNVVYLFGTVHVGKAEFYPLNMATTRALTGAAFLVVEADTLNQAAVAKQVTEFAMLSPPSSLDQQITPVLMDKLTSLLEKYKFPKERAMRLKPWMLATTLVTLEAKQSGYDPGWAAETYLLGFAKAQNKPIIEIEGLSYQFEIFNGLSAEQQLAFLEKTVEEIEKGSARKRVSTIVEAWASANASDLEKLRQDSLRSQSNVGKYFNARLFEERNAIMAVHIDEYLRSGKSHFVAVGALHLVGEKNIIDLLKGRGYQVREL